MCAKICHAGHEVVAAGNAKHVCSCGRTGCAATSVRLETCPSCGAPCKAHHSFCAHCGADTHFKSASKAATPAAPTRRAPSPPAPSAPPQRPAPVRPASPPSSPSSPSKPPPQTIEVPPVSPQITALQFEGVFLDMYKYKHPQTNVLQCCWLVRNNRKFNSITITIDFSGSSGLNLGGGWLGGTKQTSQVGPASVKKVAEVSSTAGKAYTLMVGYVCKLEEEAKEQVKQQADKSNQQQKQDAQNLKKLGISSKTPINEITQKCSKAGALFVDNDFPPSMSSIHKERGNPLNREVVWKRPAEFLDRVSVFDGIDPNDINQGMLGNCWFCCALSAVAEFPNLIQDMFVSKVASSVGVYQLRLYNETEADVCVVTVDDLFPCNVSGGPLFTSNKGNEIWVLLIEKAYAKMMGCYFGLRSGSPADAFSDLTGCPVQSFNFSSAEWKQEVESGRFFSRVEAWDKRKCVMAAGKYGEDKWSEMGGDPANKAGLVPGHAYSLIEAKQAHGVQLVQLRNPWGRFEWQGDWSDRSPLWTSKMKTAFKPVFDDSDGLFYMSYQHFMQNFDNLDVCFTTTPSGRPWQQRRLQSSFSAATLLPEAYYVVEVKSPCIFSCTLFQADARVPGSVPCIEAGLVLVDQKMEQAFAWTGLDSSNRQCSTETTVPRGSYYLVPFTPGLKLEASKRKSHSFIVAIHTDSASSLPTKTVTPTADLATRARVAHLRAVGKTTAVGGHQILSHVSATASCFAIACAAGAAGATEFTLDFTGSKNVRPKRQLKVTAILKPGEAMVVQELVAINEKQPVSVAYTTRAASTGV
eukprot:gb/GEZN01001709.1/.p1 GENE.gb/GEZN01001709.1/~~gb/GEZN01001709.1/.p1  ORF type:complete len:881 (-),score=102.55 gb/GEZN01001709.1/:225-2648(-)